MPIYQVTVIFSLKDQGWTETYYRESDSARNAANLGTPEQMVNTWLLFRPAATVLEAVRAQQVDGLRPMYLKLYRTWLMTDLVRPDVTAASAILRVNFVGGGFRHVYIRGVADEWVKRFGDGLDDPRGVLSLRLRDLIARYRELGFRGKRTLRREKFQILRAFPHPTNPESYTQIVCRNDFSVSVGETVDFLGPDLHRTKPILGVCREKGYLVADFQPGLLTIVNPWPENLKDQTFRGNYVRRFEYDYPAFEDVEFVKFGTFRTSTRYHAASWAPDNPTASPINPCGRIVDYLRVCDRVRMRLFFDTAAEIPVTWYFVNDPPRGPFEPLANPPQTRPNIPGPVARHAIPFEHPFGSRHWDLANGLPQLLIGELYQPRTWYSGRPPVELDGGFACGDLGQWGVGASGGDPVKPVNAFTLNPCCCGPGVRLGEGGGVGGGLAVLNPRIGGGVGGGRAVLNPRIGGGTSGGGYEILTCPVWGNLIPDQYRVTIAGATDSREPYNGQWVLDYQGPEPPNQCFWLGETVDGDPISLIWVPKPPNSFSARVTVVHDGGASASFYHLENKPESAFGAWTFDYLVTQSGPMPASVLVESLPVATIPNPRAYYPFEGSTVDWSGNGHDLGSLVSIAYATGKFGQCLTNGQGERQNQTILDCGLQDGPYSIQFWFRYPSGSTGPFVRIYDVPALPRILELLTWSTGIRVNIDTTLEGTSQQFNGAATVADSEWHHLVLTVEDAACLVYLDGEVLISDTIVSTSQINTDMSFLVSTTGDDIDDYAIWDAALTPEQVTLIFEHDGPLSDLVETEPPSFSLSFDGTDDYVTNQDFTIDGSPAGTISFWFKAPAQSGNRYLVSMPHTSSGANGFDVHTSSATNLTVWLRTSGGVSLGVSATVNYDDGQWHHVAGTYNGTTLSLYYDGALKNSSSRNGTIEAAATEINIGKFGTFGACVVASIDDVRIYSRDLSPEEVADVAANLPVDSTGLVGWWKFDEGTGVTAYDASGEGNHGTLTNGPTWSTDTPF